MRPLQPDDPAAIGPYRLLGVLGAGGMGRVYLGRNAGGRTVAVKVIHTDLAGDNEFRTRFRREVAAARSVTGPHSVPVIDADPEARQPWLATVYVAGSALGEAVENFGPLPESALAPLGTGLARAVAEVHRAGVIHRDIKPSNVLLTVDGPRLIDFGIARAADAGKLTTTGRVIGSPGYMAPEHISGDAPAGPPVDIFALGAVLVYAAAGSGPFGTGDSIAMLWRVMQEPARLDGVPAALRPLVAACLDKNPANRPTPAAIEAHCVGLGGDDSAILPAPLLEDISRRAVQLLDVDTHAGTPAHTAPTIAPPPPVHPATPPAPATMVNPNVSGSTPEPFVPQGQSRQPGRTRTVVITAGIVVLLLVAGGISALLATTHSGSGGSRAATSAPATADLATAEQATTTRPASGAAALPGGFVGTWKGTASDGLAGFDIVVTLKAGAVGAELGTSSNTGHTAHVTCSSTETLTAATASKITLRARLVSGDGCLDNGRDSTLELNPDGTAQYSMPSPLVGSISGSLRKQ
ncbi:MAG: protein kinase [Nocardia sp.]|nr:protein kinase [Nocardia sp.]